MIKEYSFKPIALRTAKTLSTFGCSECNRVNKDYASLTGNICNCLIFRKLSQK